MKNNFLHFGLMALAAFLLAGFLHFQSPNFADPDGFYYIRNAWLYRTHSLFDTQFPWTQFSSIELFGSDLWYGISFILAPLTYFNDLALAEKIAGVIFTALFLIGFFWVVQRHQVPLKFLWPFVALLAVPLALYQLVMIRPQTLSLLLGIILFSLLARGSWWGVFLASLGLTFLHLNFFWIEIFILGIFILFYCSRCWIAPFFSRGVAIVRDEKFDWVKVAAVVAGGIAGWLLRPHPISAAKLLYIQVIKLMAEKQGSLPLIFGFEWYPFDWIALIKVSALFLIIWVPAIVFLVWTFRKYRSSLLGLSFEKSFLLWGSFIISLTFFLLTLFVARRSLMLWVVFGVLFIAFLYAYVVSLKPSKSSFLVVLTLIFLCMAPYSLYRNNADMARAIPPDKHRESALWLKENSRPGDIVFNAQWDNFSMLFFWNQKNYYIGGLDPIFQYAYDPSLYWKFHHISRGESAEFTCGALNCTAKEQEDTYVVLRRDFNARYIFIEYDRNPRFYRALESDQRFEKEFEFGQEAIFEVLPR